jgi:two-component system sensor histidine kinase KdpD
MRRFNPRDLARLVAVAVPSLAGATLAIAVLQGVGVPNASAVYLAAVVATAFVAGTWGAIVAAVASFLLYDFLFVFPL